MSAISAEAIQQQIQQDIQCCEALLGLLDDERKALRDRNMDELERILVSKAQHLELLEKDAHARTEMAKSYANTSDSQASQDIWRKIIEDLQSTEIEEQWTKLKELFRLCKVENEVNGKLLARNHQIYARLLDLVRGQTAAPSLYTSQGSTSGGGASHIVGEA